MADRDHPSHKLGLSGNQLPSCLSRRTVISGLVELTLMIGGVT